MKVEVKITVGKLSKVIRYQVHYCEDKCYTLRLLEKRQLDVVITPLVALVRK